MQPDRGLQVLSAVDVAEDSETELVLPHWHVSVVRRDPPSFEPSVASDEDLEQVRAAFLMGGAEEDNHGPGVARHLWMVCGGEGVVLKRYDWTNRYGRQPWAKVVRNEFKESNRRSFGVTEKTGEFQVELAIAQEFCTPTLVGKTRAKVVAAVASAQGIDLTGPNAQRLVESVYRGKVIPQLLGRVFHDLVVEELWPAVKKHRNPVVDFKKLERCCTEQTKRLAADLFGLTVGGGA